MGKQITFINARLIDPRVEMEKSGTLTINNGLIEKKDEGIKGKVIDCKGMCLAPGIVDIGVKVCEPGEKHKESFRSASSAAAAGGVTSLVTRPDTKPSIDNPELLEFFKNRGKEASKVRIFPTASLTKRNNGKKMTEIGFLHEGGAVAFTDGFNSIPNTKIFHQILKYASDFNTLIIGHPQDYFLTKNTKVTRFIEKPKEAKAKQIISKKGYWNSGMFYLRKDSIINNFKKYQPNIYRNCNKAVTKAKYKSNVYYLNKQAFTKATAKSFDYAILEKTKDINAIKLDIPWSDLGSWKEICKMYGRNKRHYFKKKNVFHRPWGSYVNLFNGKEFLIKELYVKPKGILSLQKHHHRAEHWVVTHGKPKITLNKKYFTMKPDETIFIPLGAIHRIENPYKKPVKIIEAQVGSILKETDIVRYQDIYGRIK